MNLNLQKKRKKVTCQLECIFSAWHEAKTSFYLNSESSSVTIGSFPYLAHTPSSQLYGDLHLINTEAGVCCKEDHMPFPIRDSEIRILMSFSMNTILALHSVCYVQVSC